MKIRSKKGWATFLSLRRRLSQSQPGDRFPILLFREVQAQSRHLIGVFAVPHTAHQPCVRMAGTQKTMASEHMRQICFGIERIQLS